MAIEGIDSSSPTNNNSASASERPFASSGNRQGGVRLSQLMTSAISRNSSSGRVLELQTALEKIYEESSKQGAGTWGNFTINNADSSLHFSTIVVTFTMAGSDLVTYMPIVITDSTNWPTANPLNISGQQVENWVPASTVVDADMNNVLIERTRRLFPQAKLTYVPGISLQPSFDVKDVGLVRDLAATAGEAAREKFVSETDPFVSPNLVNGVDPSVRYELKVDFQSGSVTDDQGLPIRKDVTVVFSELSNQNNQTSFNNGSSNRQICAAEMFFSPVWLGGADSNPYFRNQVEKITPKFAMLGVITASGQPGFQCIFTQLLSIYGAQSLAVNQSWARSFRPTMGKKVDFRDLGALNIEQNLLNAEGFGAKMKLKDNELGQFTQAVLQQNMMLAIDVPRAGVSTWYQQVWAEAAAGDSSAIAKIVEEGDNITNGALSRNLQQLGCHGIFLDYNEQHHVGMFTDSQGMQQDLRVIDYLALANVVGESNPTQLRDWTETFNPQYQPAVRLAARKKIIENVTSGTAQFYDLVDRFFFDPLFVKAWSDALNETKLNVSAQFTNAGELQVARAGANYFNRAALTGVEVGRGQRGGFGQNNQSGFGFSNRARW